jgi:nucleoside-diphosphate-sugar epimerase
MKAIVTGASGFIGSQLVAYLVKNNYKVAGISRRNIKSLSHMRQQLLRDSIYLENNLSNLEDLKKRLFDLGFFGPDLNFVFHLAWKGNVQTSDLDVSAQNRNVEFTINSYELANTLNAKRYIFCGTMEESFAKLYTKLDYKVDSKYNRHVVYALAKVTARQALKLLYKKKSPEILFATNSHVMGPGDDKDSFLQVALSKILKKRDIEMSSGEQNFDVINVVDCASAYLAIAKYGIPGSSYWVGSGNPCKLRDYIEIMNKLFPRVNIKYGALNYNDLIIEKEIFSIKKLIKDTGFEPRYSFIESVKELASYLRINNFKY